MALGGGFKLRHRVPCRWSSRRCRRLNFCQKVGRTYLEWWANPGWLPQSELRTCSSASWSNARQQGDLLWLWCCRKFPLGPAPLAPRTDCQIAPRWTTRGDARLSGSGSPAPSGRFVLGLLGLAAERVWACLYPGSSWYCRSWRVSCFNATVTLKIEVMLSWFNLLF